MAKKIDVKYIATGMDLCGAICYASCRLKATDKTERGQEVAEILRGLLYTKMKEEKQI